MNKQLEQLMDFQKMSGQVDFNRRIPTIEERKIRLKLALEELTELADAYGLNDSFYMMLMAQSDEIIDSKPANTFISDTGIYNEVEVLDALIDISYINNGSIVTSGLQDIADEAFDLVHENNMTKAHDTLEEAIKTIEFYKDKGRETDYELIVINGEIFFIVKVSNIFRFHYYS